jgi:homoserine O-acetyltransferase
MNSHDIGRGRGGTAAALRRVRARTLVAGIDSDRLYPLTQQEHLAAGIPGAGSVRVITSPNGHDAFLIEAEQVGACLGELLADCGIRSPCHGRGAAVSWRGRVSILGLRC